MEDLIEPSSGRPSATPAIRSLLLILGAQLVARTLFIYWLPADARSHDLNAWAYVAHLLAIGKDPYRETSYLSWPPFWVQHIFLFSRLSAWLHVAFFTVLKIFLIVAEAATSAAVFLLMRRAHSVPAITKLMLVGIAVNPVAILLICQHCNFDILMAFWLTISIIALFDFENNRSPVDWLLACCSLGIAILYKTVPLILTPLLLYRTRFLSIKTKALGILLCLGPAALALSVLYVLEPEQMLEKVIRYRSVTGYFGITGLLQIGGMSAVNRAYQGLFILITLVLMLTVGVIFYRRNSVHERVFVLSSLLLLLWVPAFGPGYGPQYASWYLPFMVVSFLDFGRVWRVSLLCCYLIGVVTYVEEYGLLPTHGMFLVHRGINPSLLGINWSHQDAQTLARLPLFLSFVWILCLGGYYLYRDLKAQEGDVGQAAGLSA